jgi:ATP-binding cassette subfamily B protein
MLIGDPLLLLMFLVVVAPSVKVLRKLIRRINAIAMSQFTGGAQIMETMQETIQGIRIVKSFTLEEQMRAKFDASVGTLEGDSVKMARLNRAGLLMKPSAAWRSRWWSSMAAIG